MTAPLGGSWDAGTAYDRMAEPRARALGAPWPAVARFVGRLPRGSVVLDVGVGNGRYFGLPEADGLRWVGADVSRAQLGLARRVLPAGSALVRADGRRLPLRDGAATAGVAVAVVHHLPTRPERVAVLHEMARCLRPGSPWMASAWSDVDAVARAGRRATGGGPQDVIIPFRGGLDQPVDRFYHLYREGELSAEAEEAGLGRAREVFEAENRFATGLVPAGATAGGGGRP